jgi:hypothetical protein
MASQVEQFLMSILEEEGPDDMLFQRDGAPPHIHQEVTDYLNRKFREKWIGRGGPITWPPRSPERATIMSAILKCICISFVFVMKNNVITNDRKYTEKLRVHLAII